MRTYNIFPHFPLLSFVLVATLAAGQANRTVDDFSPQITYFPDSAVTHLDTTGFDITKLYNGTIAIMNTTTVDEVNMTLTFTGTAIWLFIGKPDTSADSEDFVTGYTIYLEGLDEDESTLVDATSDAEYGDVAYSNRDLKPGQHTITLAATDTVYFDYAIFTSEESTPETTIPPVQPLAASSSASGSPSGTRSKSTSPAQAGVSAGTSAAASAAVGKKPASHVALIAGVAAGVVILVLSACVVVLCRRQRRPNHANAPEKFQPNTSQHPQMSSASPYGVQNYPPRDVHRASSNTALLRPPTVRSAATSQHTLSPTSPSSTAHSAYQSHMEYEEPLTHEGLLKPLSPAQSILTARLPAPELQRAQTLRAPFDPDPDRDADFQRMMAEQRAVEAEYARPDPAAWGSTLDEKRSLATHFADADRQGGVASTSVFAAHPISGSDSDVPRQGQDPALSSIAAEMRALRAQVARLEGASGAGRGDGVDVEPYSTELPPPAYN